jgi:hypothetical protein
VLLVQAGADLDGVCGIDGAIALLDVLDLSFLVYDEGCALGKLGRGAAAEFVGAEDVVGDEDLMVHIAQEGILDANLLGVGGIRKRAVNADSKNFGVAQIDFSFVDTILVSLKLFRSTTGEGEDVEGKDDVFLAAVIAELNLLALIAHHVEVGCGVADF